jgi:hypothetical protein
MVTRKWETKEEDEEKEEEDSVFAGNFKFRPIVRF